MVQACGNVEYAEERGTTEGEDHPCTDSGSDVQAQRCGERFVAHPLIGGFGNALHRSNFDASLYEGHVGGQREEQAVRSELG